MIRVFFKDSQEARNFNYTDYDTEREKDGYIYAFTGLRGDAKQLYREIKEGKETRVSLIKAETPENQYKFVQKADLVIWACGYQTKAIPMIDQN